MICVLRFWLLVTCFLVAGFPAISVGQETPPAAIDDNRYETLRNRVTQSELSDEEKTRILEVLSQAESQAREAEAKRATSEKNLADIKAVPDSVAAAKGESEKFKTFQPEPAATDVLAELETRLTLVEGELAAAKEDLSKADASIAEMTRRRSEIESELPNLEKQLALRKSQIESAKADSDASLAAEAAMAELLASEALLQATIDAMRSESALIDAEAAAGLRQLTRDVCFRRAETLQQQQRLSKQELEAARAADAALRVESAEAQLAKLHPSLRPIGEQNRELAKQNQELAAKIEEAQAQLTRRQQRLEELRNALEQAKTRAETVGLTDAVGALLRNFKQSLPSVGANRLRIRERKPTINDAQYELIELTDRRNARLSLSVATLLRSATPPIRRAERPQLEREATSLLEEQRLEFLDPAIRSQTTYFNTLVSLSTTEQQIVQLVEEATQYTNERILWIRSSKPLWSQLTPSAAEWWFMIPAAWSSVSLKLMEELNRRPFVWIAAALVLLFLIRLRMRLRKSIQEIGVKVTRSSFTDFRPTIESLLLTIATAAPIPLVFGFLAWRLGGIAGNDQATLALAQAAQAVAIGYFPINLLRQVCRPNGLAISHFGWPEPLVIDLRRGLRWLLITTMPLVMAIGFLAAGTSVFGNDTIERYLFVAAVVLVCLFTARMLHPRRGLPVHYLRLSPTGWANRLAYFWYPLAVAVPFSLGILAVIGYYFTGQQLAWRLFLSLCLLVAVVLFMSVVLRWILLHRRELHIEQARQRRLAAATAASEASLPIPEESIQDLQSQMQQTRGLMHTVAVGVLIVGAWFIWDDVRPALDFLEKWPIWHSTTTVTETIAAESGASSTRTREVRDAITIADLMLALLVLVATFVATRNLPGMLEFAVLSRLPLDQSARYAITALARYAIILLGFVIAGKTVGLQWNQIQWMATALTFGLAFGLQEMFANFVAGIIILFEQPVRVGDVVEIDGVTGVVTQIRIRATTITNWDKKDFIVPNKEFITGKVLNWTRSDEVSRLVITVGIAYGSDAQRARELLEGILRDHPHVMQEPAPLVVFDQFSDSTLNFTLRAFVGSLDKRLSVTHDVHVAIDKTFRDAGIEIAFPQRDLHLRTIPDELRTRDTDYSISQQDEQDIQDSDGSTGFGPTPGTAR